LKTIGLVGGMSWESSAEYYRIINQGVRERLGGLHSAKSVMVSVDFGEIERLQHEGRWNDLAHRMIEAARQVERAGADFFVMCTNTMHRLAEEVETAVAIPFLHIADPTAERIKMGRHTQVGLIGTAFTMEQAFYKARLTDRHGLEVIIPEKADRDVVHRIIYDELVAGRVLDASRDAYRGVIARLVERGAEAVILGCTEIMLLIRPEDSAVPLYDTTAIHAEAAIMRAIETAY
jgi:aspartate racemase